MGPPAEWESGREGETLRESLPGGEKKKKKELEKLERKKKKRQIQL